MIETGNVMAVSQRGTYLGGRDHARAARKPHWTALHFTAAAR